MRNPIPLALACALVAAPSVARADLGGCLLGPGELSRCSVSGTPAAVLGAIALPVLVAGAAVSVVDELHRRTEERDDAASPPSKTARHAPPSLALVPDPPDPYRAPAAGKAETRRRANRAFQLNDTASNVATAVTGAMVVGAVIGTIVHEAQHK